MSRAHFVSLERETYWELIPTALIQEEMKKVDLRQGNHFSATVLFLKKSWIQSALRLEQVGASKIQEQCGARSHGALYFPQSGQKWEDDNFYAPQYGRDFPEK